MSDLPPPHIANERYKTISRTLFQFGSALLGADFVKVYAARTLTIEALVWLLVSVALMWVGWLALGLLETEK